MYEEFKSIGRDLFCSGLVSSHGGNLSVRVGDRILITRRGSQLAHLEDRDIIETGLYKNDSGVALASSELIVHRAIYRQTSALAIVHAHPPHSIVVSLDRDEVVPLDSEASYLLHKVPVVTAVKTVGSAEVAEIVPPVLREYKIVMLRGHGSFAVGQFLEEALQWTSCLEVASQIIYLVENGRNTGFREYRRESQTYRTW